MITSPVDSIKIKQDKSLKVLNPLPKFSIRGPRGAVSACRGETDGMEEEHKAAHDVEAARSRMALATVALPGLKIVLFLASEIFSGKRIV